MSISKHNLYGERFGIAQNERLLIVDGIPMNEGFPVLGEGKYIYVSSVTGDDALSGESPATAVATLDAAVALCTASKGYIIVAMQNHAENLTAADAVDIDIAGVAVVGLGTGTDRPTFTMTNVAGEITIGAANVTLQNLVINASEPDTLKGVNVEAGVNYVTIRNCEFGVDTANTDEFTHAISFENGSTGSIIEGCLIDQALGNATAGIIMDADTDQLIIRNNIVRGDYSTANIVGNTTLSTNLLIDGNLLINGEAGSINAQPTIELLTGTTGVIQNNNHVCNVASPDLAVVADTCMLFNEQYSETVAAASVSVPLVAANEIKIAMKKDALTTLDDLFTVGVGDILVHGLWFITTTAETGGTNPVVSLILDATTSAQDFTIATGLDLASIAISDTLTFTAVGAVLVKTAGGLASPHRPFIVAPGVIETVLDSGSYSAGDGTWFMAWSPITAGATVVAA